MTDPGQGTLVAFTTAADPQEVVSACHQSGVVIRSLPNGWLRASCGWWNSEQDVERLLAALPRD
jgi:selenocysteine lyase/cysteine desulfurase